jgi:hypothetical protein
MRAILALDRDELNAMIGDWFREEMTRNPHVGTDVIARDLALDLEQIPEYVRVLLRHYLPDILEAIAIRQLAEEPPPPAQAFHFEIWQDGRLAIVLDDIKERQSTITVQRPTAPKIRFPWTQPEPEKTAEVRKPAKDHPWRAPLVHKEAS